MRFRKKGWVLNSSIWRAVLSLFYPPVIIGGKNGKNSENPVGSNKSEKRKPKSAVYRSFWASVVYFHLRLISTKSHKREMTRNQVVAQAARGFESHPIRHDHASSRFFRLLAFLFVQIKPPANITRAQMPITDPLCDYIQWGAARQTTFAVIYSGCNAPARKKRTQPVSAGALGKDGVNVLVGFWQRFLRAENCRAERKHSKENERRLIYE